MLKIRTPAALLLLAFFLTACGGGGNGGFTDVCLPDPNPPDPETGPDSFFSSQWHLTNGGLENINLGQTVSENANQEGEVNGEGVTIAIIDDGLEINHPDLWENVIECGSYNFRSTGNRADPTPTNSDNSHGTAVSGVAAARGWNNLGIRGVAPKASLVGFNFLATTSTQLTTNLIYSTGGANFSSGIEIFNMSFGQVYPFENISTDDDIDEWFYNGVTEHRNGKGAILIKASGNEAESVGLSIEHEDEDNFHQSQTACDAANNANVPCGDPNLSHLNNFPTVITIGANTPSNTRSSFSSPGSALWVSAPGSGEEIGNIATTNALLTTDLSGCERGNNQISSATDPTCDFENNFSGTSAATPIVSGVAALLLDANPDLSYRDVKRILALNTLQIDAFYPALEIEVGGQNLEVLQAWTTNKANIPFSNHYGFGKVNVAEAVAMANTYNEELGTQQVIEYTRGARTSTNSNGDEITGTEIPDGDAIGVADTLLVNENLIIEAVQVSVKISRTDVLQANSETQPSLNPDLTISISSPADTLGQNGTKSILLRPYNPLNGYNDLDKIFLTNAFLDELSSGIWTLNVYDVNNNGVTGTLIDWSIKIFGRNPLSSP